MFPEAIGALLECLTAAGLALSVEKRAEVLPRGFPGSGGLPAEVLGVRVRFLQVKVLVLRANAQFLEAEVLSCG